MGVRGFCSLHFDLKAFGSCMYRIFFVGPSCYMTNIGPFGAMRPLDGADAVLDMLLFDVALITGDFKP